MNFFSKAFTGGGLSLALVILMAFVHLPALSAATYPVPFETRTVQISIEDVMFRTVPPSGPDIIVSPNPATTELTADPDSGLVIYGLEIRDTGGKLLYSSSFTMPAELSVTVPKGLLLFRFDTGTGYIDKWVDIR